MRRCARAEAVLHEYPDRGSYDLRATIGKYLDVASEQVVVGAGSSTLMHAGVDAFTTPGGEIVCLDPGFTVYSETALSHDRRPIQMPLREEDFLSGCGAPARGPLRAYAARVPHAAE